MHRQMEANHRQMMSGNRGGHMQGRGMMGEGTRMGMHMQGRMTGEWYQQMMGMHGQMAAMHQGEMPSFKARLSTSEIAAILNHLRSESDGDLPEITSDDVNLLAKTYSGRSWPWSASELQSQPNE